MAENLTLIIDRVRHQRLTFAHCFASNAERSQCLLPPDVQVTTGLVWAGFVLRRSHLN